MNEGQRNKGSQTVTSINYLTGKTVVTHRDSEDDTPTRRTTVRRGSLLSIDAVGDGLMFDPLAKRYRTSAR